MSASKHTPGPWVINDQVDMLFIEADGAPVASVEVGEGPDEAEGAEADAALIAAAPELLEVAESIVLRGHATGCASVASVDRPGARKAGCDCLFKTAAAAIAKARGGA